MDLLPPPPTPAVFVAFGEFSVDGFGGGTGLAGLTAVVLLESGIGIWMAINNSLEFLREEEFEEELLF